MVHYCDYCDRTFSNPRCPMCNRPPARRAPDPPGPEVQPISTFVSGPEGRVETDEDLVERTSRPSLATLVKRGLKAGLIHVMPEYAQGKKR